MATSKPIDENDIIKSGTIEKLLSEFDKLYVSLKKNDDALRSIAKDMQNIKPPTSTKDFEKLLSNIDKLESIYKTQHQTQKDLLKVEQEQERLRKMKLQTEAQEIRNQKLKEQGTVREQTAYQKLSRELTNMRNRYKDLAVQQSQGVKLTRDEVREFNNLEKKIRSTDKTLKDIDANVGQFQRNVGNYTSAWKGFTGALSQLGLAFSGLSILKSAFNTLSEFDEKLADIQKTSGLTKEAATDLSLELGKLDTRSSVTALQELASAGGRLGLQTKKDILEFAKAADTAFVALGDDLDGTAEEIATNLGKVSSAFGDELRYGVGESITRTGSSLNELSANSKASAGAILDFTNRMAGVASVSGIAQTDIQALGALFDSTGQSIEVASTTLNTLLPALSTNYKKFADVAGMTAEEFKELVGNNPIEALKQVAIGSQSSEKGLNGLVETLKSFGIESSRGAAIVGTLANNVDELTKLQKISSDAFRENTSLQDEFNTKNSTLNAGIEKLRKEWDLFIINLGQSTGASNIFTYALNLLANNLTTVINVLGSLIAAWISYRAIIKTIQIANQIKDIGGLSGAFKSLTGNVNESAKANSNFANSLKGIGWTVAIGLVIELARALYDVASGAERSRQEQEILNKFLSIGAENANFTLTQLKEGSESLRRFAAASGKTGKELEKTLSSISENYRSGIIEAIDSRLYDLKLAENRLDEFVKENGRNISIARETNPLLLPANASLMLNSFNNQKSIVAGLREEIKTLQGELNNLDSSKTDKKINELTSKLEDSKITVSDYTKAIRDLKNELIEGADEIETEYLQSVAKAAAQLEDQEAKVYEERKKENITQIKANEYLQQLRINHVNTLEVLWRDFNQKRLDEIEERRKAERESLIESLQLLEEASAFTLGRESTQERIKELRNYNQQRNEILDSNLMSDEERQKRIEELELSHQKRMLDIQIEYTRESIDFQLSHIERIRSEMEQLLREQGIITATMTREQIDKIIEATDEYEQAGTKYLELEEQLQELLKQQADFATQSSEKAKGLMTKVADYFSNLMDAIQSKIDEVYDRMIQGQNRIIDNSKSMIDYLRQAAAAGNLQAKESILAEEKQIEEAQRRIEKLEKQRQRAQLITGLLSTYSQKAASGDKNALMSTITDATLLSAFLRSLPSFDKGADRLNNKGQNIDGKGGFLTINHPDERIIKADQNKRIGYGWKNEQIVNVMEAYKKGFLMPVEKIPVMMNTKNDLSELKSVILDGFSNINNWNVSLDQLFSTFSMVVEQSKKGNINRTVKYWNLKS